MYRSVENKNKTKTAPTLPDPGPIRLDVLSERERVCGGLFK